MITKREDWGTSSANEGEWKKDSVKEIIDCLEEVIKEDLSKADKNEDIEIKLFKGLKLKSTYVPSHVGKNPKTNKDIIVKDKIKISCKLTDYFKNKLL